MEEACPYERYAVFKLKRSDRVTIRRNVARCADWRALDAATKAGERTIVLEGAFVPEFASFFERQCKLLTLSVLGGGALVGWFGAAFLVGGSIAALPGIASNAANYFKAKHADNMAVYRGEAADQIWREHLQSKTSITELDDGRYLIMHSPHEDDELAA